MPPLLVGAEIILRDILKSRDQDTITGDLLEEYCEVAVPALGISRARFWYLRQVVSLATIGGVRPAHAEMAGKKWRIAGRYLVNRSGGGNVRCPVLSDDR